MIGKKIGAAFMFAIFALLLSTMVLAASYDGNRENVTINSSHTEQYRNTGEIPGMEVTRVLIEGIERSQGSRLELDRGQEIEVKVEIEAQDNVSGVNIEARINGDKVISEYSDSFDVKDGNAYIKKFTLNIPSNIDRSQYNLWINVWSKNGAALTYNYPIEINAQAPLVVINDVIFNPSYEVIAGRALLTVVRIENAGSETEDSVKVKVEIPELNLYAVDYIDELAEDDQVSSEEMYLRIPSTAKTGQYKVQVTAEYDDGDKVAEEEYKINVIGDGSAQTPANTGNGQAQTPASRGIQITAGPQTQDTARGQGGVIYPVSVINSDADAKTMTLSVTGVEAFGTVKISPSTLLVVNPGATETFYVYVSAMEDTSLGSHTFGVSVKNGNDVLKEFPLSVNVIEGPAQKDQSGWDGVKTGLLVGLIILIVVLVVLGFIIAFNKIKGSEDEEEDNDDTASQTYY